MPSREAIARIERWFLSRGIPHFIHDYQAAKDILTRALPLLTLIFLFELANAANASWVWWANVLAVVGGFGILLGALALSNALRHRRLLERPHRVGFPEITVFVAAPALLPLVFGGQVKAAVVTLAGNLTFLAVIYLATSYGVVPMLGWAGGRIMAQLGTLIDLVGRALPLLLLVIGLLLLTGDVWLVSASLTRPFFAASLGLLVLAGAVFVLVRLPRELARLERFDSWSEVRELAAGTPAAALPQPDVTPLEAIPPPRRRQWGNAALVALFSQGVQILLVSVTVFAFLLLIGLLAITPRTIEVWTTVPVHELASFGLWGRDLVLSTELVRVSAFLATFSGLYFTVYALADQTYREEFFEDVTREVRQAFAVRAVYLSALGVGARSSPPVVSSRE